MKPAGGQSCDFGETGNGGKDDGMRGTLWEGCAEQAVAKSREMGNCREMTSVQRNRNALREPLTLRLFANEACSMEVSG